MDAVFTILAIVIGIAAFDLVALVFAAESRDGFREDRLPAGLR
jgi:hypothetical protein